MSGRQAKRERTDARNAYVRQFFLAYIRRLRGILKRLGPTLPADVPRPCRTCAFN